MITLTFISQSSTVPCYDLNSFVCLIFHCSLNSCGKVNINNEAPSTNKSRQFSSQEVVINTGQVGELPWISLSICHEQLHEMSEDRSLPQKMTGSCSYFLDTYLFKLIYMCLLELSPNFTKRNMLVFCIDLCLGTYFFGHTYLNL